jgi:hypothetical protein
LAKFINLYVYLNSNFLHCTKMKRNLVKGIILISAIALSSCSVNKTASTSKSSDDVYFSQATAGEEPQYVSRPAYRQDAEEATDEDDYFYYDDYASRINRFSYFSPFGYYDYAYSPYGYNNFGWGSGFGYGGYGLGWGGYGGGFGLGLGFGYGGYGGLGWGGYGGFGYSPWGYGYGFSPYSYYGIGYGGGYPYWGVYSAYNNARPNRGNGSPNRSLGNSTSGRTGYAGRPGYNGTATNNGIGYYPGGRSVRNVNGISVGRPGRNGTTINERPTRQERPVYQPQTIERSSPSPSYGGGGSRGGGGSSGGGGGGRPGRP